MKICILTTTFPRYTGDTIPQFVLGLARALVEEGAQVRVIAPHDHDTASDEIMNGVEVRRFAYWWPKSAQALCYGAGIPGNIRRNKWAALQLPPLEMGFFLSALRYARDCDLINAHWSFAGIAAAAAARLMHKPLVTHTYSVEYLPKAMRPVNRIILANSRAIISNSQFTHQLVEKTARPQHHVVIGSGVNPEKIAPADFDRSVFRHEKGFALEDFVIFAVGRLIERKGYPVLIDAAARLIQQGRRVRLMIGGSGPQRDALANQIAAHGLAPESIFLGYLPDAELACYLAAADVLVMPSIIDQQGDTEGLGIPLIEAMANHTPVIASQTGGIGDIVRHEQNGLLVTPGNADELAAAIARLQEDPALRKKLIEAGIKFAAEDFSWRTLARRTLDCFEIALSAQKTSRS